MQIGKLNDFYPDIVFSYHFADSVQVPPAGLPGNPLRGELLQIKWAELRDEDLCLQIRLPEACFVDTVSLHLGVKTALRRITRQPWSALDVVARYVIRYAATYYSDSRVRYTQDGQIVTYYIYEYIPKQNKPIASVTLEQDDRFDAHVFLAQLEGVRV